MKSRKLRKVVPSNTNEKFLTQKRFFGRQNFKKEELEIIHKLHEEIPYE